MGYLVCQLSDEHNRFTERSCDTYHGCDGNRLISPPFANLSWLWNYDVELVHSELE